MIRDVDHDEGVDVGSRVEVKDDEMMLMNKLAVANMEMKVEREEMMGAVQRVGAETDPKFLSYLQIWLVLAFNYVYQYLKRLSDSVQLQAELNKTKAKQVCRSMDLLETSDHDCSFSSGRESGYYSVQQQSPCKEYASSECPSLSPLLSDDIKVYNDHSLPMFKLPLAKRLGPAGSAKNAQIDVLIPDFESTAKFLIKSVNETKYVTAIFEATDGGIDVLIQDVLSEFQLWFEENGLLGIACEVHWSVPEKRRNRLVETRMKEGIHQALRKNNRKVMDLKNDKSRNLPLMLAESSTQENTFRQTTLNCFQGKSIYFLRKFI
uniref:Uncharacterized protein n=1 Tax=Plectus sambesii TaxID=2011161 RepID=A0A914WRH9_9BILA